VATKILHIDQIGDIQITKRKGQRTIRLTIQGEIAKVTQPAWLPYSAGESFAKARIEWIKEHIKTPHIYEGGQSIGSLTLQFARSSGTSLSSKQSSSTLEIRLPAGRYPADADVQQYVARKATALTRASGEEFIPKRVAELATMFGFKYRSVQIRQLKRRWGSCNSKKELVFNLNLMRLDPLHIDYVILHELTHTLHMNHGPDFWSHLESVYPGAKKIAKVVRRINF
jgi:predicted metal-dependent hydrolase